MRLKLESALGFTGIMQYLFNRKKTRNTSYLDGFLLLLVLLTVDATAQVVFQDVTEGSGIEFYKGKSFGVSCGDLTGNGLPDIFISNHRNLSTLQSPLETPYILVNNGNWTFDQSIYELTTSGISDLHGGLIFDFNNDGRNDILLASGGAGGNLFYVNDGSPGFGLNNKAQEYGIFQEYGRGRLHGCFDIDNDGIPDVLLNNQENALGISPPTLMRRNFGESYFDYNTEAGVSFISSRFSTLQDFNLNGKAELMVLSSAINLFRINNGQLQPAASYIQQNVNDIAIGDFNGDLIPDFYLAKGIIHSEIRQNSATEIRSVLANANLSDVFEFRFSTNDSLILNIIPRTTATSKGVVYVGGSGIYNNSANTPAAILNTMLSVNDPLFAGSRNFSITYNGWQVAIDKLNSNTFRVRMVSFFSSTRLAISIKATGEIFNFEHDPLPVVITIPGFNKDAMVYGGPNFQISLADNPVLQSESINQGVIAADFDNDMDLDIYVVNYILTGNPSNYLLENQGNGQFLKHESAWGADGGGIGVGESASFADFDNDGFLDLIVSNGLGIFYLEDATYKLYRNLGNNNNWVKLELRGTQSTRGAYGTVVYAYAGGVAQMRTQNAGEHSRSQNDPRLHFGMAQNTAVDSLIIYWPSGVVTKQYNIPVNHIYKIEEPDAFDVKFDIYPNPAKEVFFATCQDERGKYVRITSHLGSIVSETAVNFSSIEPKAELSTPALTGNYYVELLNLEGAVISRRRLSVY